MGSLSPLKRVGTHIIHNLPASEAQKNRWIGIWLVYSLSEAALIFNNLNCLMFCEVFFFGGGGVVMC